MCAVAAVVIALGAILTVVIKSVVGNMFVVSYFTFRLINQVRLGMIIAQWMPLMDISHGQRCLQGKQGEQCVGKASEHSRAALFWLACLALAYPNHLFKVNKGQIPHLSPRGLNWVY